VTALLENRAGRFPLACGDDPATLGVRVPVIPLLAGVGRPVLQSSANRAGDPDPRRLDDVPELFKAAADLVIDGGELPGTASTVIDMRRYETGATDAYSIVRPGAVGEDQVEAALGGQFHFNPDTYEEMIKVDLPDYDAFQAAVVAGSGDGGVRSILELGTGTGETARRLLARFPDASLIGVDESEGMLSFARGALPTERVGLSVARLQDPLPTGEFDLVASALCVHHLDGAEKADLFVRVREALRPGGRFVLGDVVVPAAGPSAATAPLTPGYDKPSTVAEQLRWLAAAGFDASVTWEKGDLAVIVATATAADIVGTR
jgi:SAM-dependent methyltransferase